MTLGVGDPLLTDQRLLDPMIHAALAIMRRRKREAQHAARQQGLTLMQAYGEVQSQLGIQLHPKQMTALASPGTELLFGGAAGPGKSFFLRAAAILWCHAIPGLQVYMFRRTHPELYENHMEGPKAFPTLLAPWIAKGYARINLARGDIDIGKSRILLGHCQHEKSVYSFQGAEIHLLLIDELTHFLESQYRYLRSRVRMIGLKVADAFHGLFPRIIAASNPGNIGHCIPHGDVLTPSGWIPIQELRVGDPVYTITPHGAMTETIVSQVHRHVYKGHLWKAKTRSLSITCTPEHRIAKLGGTRSDRLARFSLVAAQDLPGQAYVLCSTNFDGKPLEHFSPKIYPTRQRKYVQPTLINGDDYCELVGWMLSEGFVGDESQKKFGISQSKAAGREIIAALLQRCGFIYRSTFQSFEVFAPDWWSHFRSFGLSRWKRIPRHLLSVSSTQLRKLFRALMGGDGHWQSEGSGQYYTVSPGLSDDVAELAVKLGYAVNVTDRQRENRLGYAYCVNFTSTPTEEILTGQHQYDVHTEMKRRKHVSSQPFSGYVYDIGVANTHTFIVRQEGTVWISGNSFVKRMFVSPQPAYEVWQTPAKEGGFLRQFIPGLMEDNPSLLEDDPGYGNRLEGLGNEALVKAMRSGIWDIVAGGMLDDLWDEGVHTIPPFVIPDTWAVYRAFDWGSSRPFSVGWWAKSDGTTAPNGRTYPKGTLFRIAEWYGALPDRSNEGLRMLAVDVARGILDREVRMDSLLGTGFRQITAGPADSSIFDEENGNCIARDMSRASLSPDDGRRCTFRPADKRPGSRHTGWEAFRKMLSASTKFPMEDPGLLVFNTCREFIRLVPTLPRDAHDPEDADTAAEDHIADESRYMITWTPPMLASQKVSGV